MTPAALADEIGVGRSTIYRWLAGEGSPSLQEMDTIAKVLGYADAWAMRPTKSFVENLPKK